MQLYEIHDFDDAPMPAWRRTLEEAHERAKESQYRDEVSITLRRYPSDQAAFCGLFNGERPEGEALRRWKLSARGGLREVPLGGPREIIPAPKQRKED